MRGSAPHPGRAMMALHPQLGKEKCACLPSAHRFAARVLGLRDTTDGCRYRKVSGDICNRLLYPAKRKLRYRNILIHPHHTST